MSPEMPKPPEGFQRPGIPGAGNLLDPAVRGHLREQLQEAAHGAKDQLQQQRANDQASTSEEPAPAEASAPPSAPRLTPGSDFDLSFIAANVPREPVKPRRGNAGRRFYFLPEDTAHVSDGPNQSAPAPKPPANPKPG